jgi:hypothetical protein
MFQPKPKNAERAEHRAQQSARMTAAPSLADEFPRLKSLTMELEQYDGNGVTRISQMKQSLNLKSTSSIIRIHCGNMDCVRGDFELTDDLAKAVAAHRTSITGELRCEGWRNNGVIGKVRCSRMLRYKLILAYGAAVRKPAASRAASGQVGA